MNPEDSSTEKLSDVFLDRFDIIYMSYPETVDVEKEIVLKKGKKIDVDFPESLLNVTIGFIHWLRRSEKLEKKPSVRASLGLYERAQSYALLNKRKKVEFQDIEHSINSVLSHRIRLKASVKYLQTSSEFIKEEFKRFMHSNQGKELKSDSP